MNFPVFGSMLPPHGLNLISCKPVTEVKFFTPCIDTRHSHADKASSVFVSTYPLLFFLIHRQGTFSSTGPYKISLSSLLLYSDCFLKDSALLRGNKVRSLSTLPRPCESEESTQSFQNHVRSIQATTYVTYRLYFKCLQSCVALCLPY